MKGWHKTAELRRLDAALMVLAETNEDIMFLSELDGFCTGLIVSLEMIPPSQLLKEVWGGTGEPEFEMRSISTSSVLRPRWRSGGQGRVAKNG